MTESLHPAVDDRTSQLDELTSLLRRLVAGVVTHQSDPQTTASLAAEVHALADHLEGLEGRPLDSRYGTMEVGFDPARLFAFDPVFGRFNPVALPVVARWEDSVAVADATFTHVYEGPPDSVHGAVLAATFDQVCNVANIGNGVAGFTVDLEVRYRAPTRIGDPVRFQARVLSIDEREITTEAHATQRGEVTASAMGRFRRLGTP